MAGTRVYIGKFSCDAGERDLERFFKGYGRLREVLLKKGFGFVEFEDQRDADDAIYELNGKKFLGARVNVEKARRKPHRNGPREFPSGNYRSNRNDEHNGPARVPHRLIVENLSSRVSSKELEDFMRQAGEVTYSNKRRNGGVVEFASRDDMRNALKKLDDAEMNGRRLKLYEDKPYRSRSRSRKSQSPKRQRSRTETRSRSRDDSRFRSAKQKHSERGRSRSRSTSRRTISDRRSRSRSAKRGRKSHSRSPYRNTRSYNN